MQQGYSDIITHGKNKHWNNNNPQTNRNDSSAKKQQELNSTRLKPYQITKKKIISLATDMHYISYSLEGAELQRVYIPVKIKVLVH